MCIRDRGLKARVCIYAGPAYYKNAETAAKELYNTYYQQKRWIGFTAPPWNMSNQKTAQEVQDKIKEWSRQYTGAVSYTHLDVYKRQTKGDLICLEAIVLNESGMNRWCW